MKADFTRKTFDPSKHFTRVLMQQGRVQLDADWNEQTAILLKYLQALAADLIGPHGGPVENLGFQIAAGMSNDFGISPGRYYVDGILCELEPRSQPIPITGIPSKLEFQIPASSAGSFLVDQWVLLSANDQIVAAQVKSVGEVKDENPVTVSLRTTLKDDVTTILKDKNAKVYPQVTTFTTQPDYPVPSTSLAAGLAYLDVWERLVTYVEDDSIREVALNGAETAARSKLICQVKLWPDFKPNSDLKTQFQPANRGFLKAVAKQQSISPDPCVIAPDARYRGPENQLYRVEIHTGGEYAQASPANKSGPTFKWSRENGSVVFPIVSLAAGSANTTTVILENLGRDNRFGLKENDWVEVQDDDYVLLNNVGPLLRVHAIASGSLSVTLAGSPLPKVGTNPKKHPLLRRWDQTAGDQAQGGLQLGSDNAALIVEGSKDANWLNLEDGIQIQFQFAQGAPNRYRTGDYWLIPARTATGDVQWPATADGETLAVPPDGVDHHYAPLATISIVSSTVEVPRVDTLSFESLPALLLRLRSLQP